MNNQNYDINNQEDFLMRLKIYEDREKRRRDTCKKYHLTQKGKEKRRLASNKYYWRKIKKSYHPIYNPEAQQPQLIETN